MQWAPDGIIKMVYPEEKNKEVVGLNLFEYKKIRNSALKSFRTKRPHINGPIKLVQGGEGIIFRFPVFQIQNSTHSEKGFLGFSAVVFDWKDIENKIEWDNENYNITLRINEDTLNTEIGKIAFKGNPKVFESSLGVTANASNSFGNWTIGATLKKGNLFFSTIKFYFINTLLLVLILGYWTFNLSVKAFYK